MNVNIFLVTQAANIRATFESSHSLTPYIQLVRKPCWFHLQNQSAIHPLIIFPVANILIQVTINSCLDYCNSLFWIPGFSHAPPSIYSQPRSHIGPYTFRSNQVILFLKTLILRIKAKAKMLLWCPHTSPSYSPPGYLCELISYYFPHSLYSNITWRHLNFFVYFQHILISVSHFRKGKLFFPFLELSFECFSNLLIHLFTSSVL